jgi:AraC family ethanolamine operon transcriptional activator
LKQAIAYITEHADVPPTIRDICQNVGVSQKTLEYAFLDHFGVTPKRYLQTYRLNGVRKVLRQADPNSTKIADVANYWGFWHMGQFAKDYRTLFGELPSETLRH